MSATAIASAPPEPPSPVVPPAEPPSPVLPLPDAAELLAQAAELGYAPSAYRLGECYEYGKMGCPQDPALSIHYYVRPLLRAATSH